MYKNSKGCVFASCQNSDISVFEHFIDVSKLSKRANNAEVEIKDYELTR